MTPKVGDTVRYLNAVGGGRVTRITDNIAYVDEDGFETPVLVRECVVVEAASPAAAQTKKHSAKATPADAGKHKSKEVAAPGLPANAIAKTDEAVIELPGGDSLNIVLGFEPSDLKQLSSATFDAYLVNDSNYFLYLTFLTRGNENRTWAYRFDGVIEPNMQVHLAEILREDLPEMDRVVVQYIAFKRSRDFELLPASVELKLDTTKFSKVHCFQKNTYFESPVIALDITHRDIATRQMHISSGELEQALKSKKRHHATFRRQQTVRTKQKQEIIEIDLHASEVPKTRAGLSNADILNAQIDHFAEVMDANIRNIGQKIVFIHGKGEGVLRQAIMKELTHRYKGHDVQDASFHEYGFYATQVTIRQLQQAAAALPSKKKKRK